MSCMFRNNGRRCAVLLAAAIFLTAALSSCGQEDASLDPGLVVPEEPNYQTTTVTVSDFTSTKKLPATPVHLDSAELTVEEDGAKFGEFLVETGDEVKAGDPLFTYTVDASHADLTAKELELDRVQNDYARQAESYANQIERMKDTLSLCVKGTTEYELASANLALLQSQYAQLGYQTEYQKGQIQQEIEDLEERLDVQTVKAPFSGSISRLETIHEGDLIESSTILCTMRSGDRLLLQVDNDPAFRYGDTVTVTAGLLSGADGYEGRVVTCGQILPGKVTERVTYIELTDPEAAERLSLATNGLIATANAVDLSGVLVLDNDAVTTKNERNSVTLWEDDTLKHRYITVGEAGVEETWIVGGLNEDQTVVVE